MSKFYCFSCGNKLQNYPFATYIHSNKVIQEKIRLQLSKKESETLICTSCEFVFTREMLKFQIALQAIAKVSIKDGEIVNE